MAPLPGAHDMSGVAKKKANNPSPSASIILISPSNKVLLLHRVQTSSSFPSAHVFPGGNLSKHDGLADLPESQTDPNRHKDNNVYRTGAIRELFEESGILLARKSHDSLALLEVSARDRRRGRKAVHSGQTRLATWLKQQSPTAFLDTDGLVPFTHWVTPPNVPKRYTTQMYVYFVPVSEEGNDSISSVADEVETTAAEWDSARNWLDRSRRGEIILFPPQFILLYLVSQMLDGGTGEIESRREKLRKFIDTDSEPAWKDKYISPVGISVGEGGRTVLGLDKPGPELKDSGLKGETDMVVLVKFRKEGPREVEVGLRKEVLKEDREHREKESKL